MDSNHDMDRLIKILSETIPGGRDLWPLRPKQIFPYFDVDQCLDLLKKFKDLDHKKINNKEILKTLQHPTLIRQLIANVACTGLKVARELNIGNVSEDDPVYLVNKLIALLKEFSPTDPFCEKGTNFVIDIDEIKRTVASNKWFEVGNSNRRSLGLLSVDLIRYTWAVYWSYFPSIGFETYGPYDVSFKFGEPACLLIKDYFNLKPEDILPISKEFPFKSIVVYQVYKTKEMSLTFSNRVLSEENQPLLNTHFALKVDGANILNTSVIDDYSFLLNEISKKQTDYVNALTDIEKITLGAELSYYMFKNFYLKYWDSWFQKEALENTIKTLGPKFMDEQKNQNDRDPVLLAKIFDPRNNALP